MISELVRLIEADGFVDQVNRVGEEMVGEATCGVIRDCSRLKRGTGGDGRFRWLFWRVVSRLTLSERNNGSIHSKIGDAIPPPNLTYSAEKRFCTSSIPEKVWTSGIRTPARACKDVVVEGLFNG